MATKTKRAAAARPEGKSPAGAVSLTLSVAEHGLESILGAAYLLTDRAFVALDGDREATLTVTLRPKAPSGGARAALEDAFRKELATQKIRWRLARETQPLREHIAELVSNIAAAPPEDAK